VTPKGIMATGALLVLIGIIVGALASHALQSVLEAKQIHSLETAVEYQLVNGLGLLLVGLLAQREADVWLPRVAWLLLAGVIGFSGGICVMLAGAPRPLGLVTPVGGLLMMTAWSLLAWRLLARKP
jgi:uncharacterized membrane protein YgdD (TMEM256/DUF423 family)